MMMKKERQNRILQVLAWWVAILPFGFIPGCKIPPLGIYCPVHLADSEQQIPQPYFVLPDDDKSETTFYSSVSVLDKETDEIIWKITTPELAEELVDAPTEFVYGQEFERFTVEVEPIPLEINKEYSISVESFICSDHMDFTIDEDGYLIEHDL